MGLQGGRSRSFPVGDPITPATTSAKPAPSRLHEGGDGECKEQPGTADEGDLKELREGEGAGGDAKIAEVAEFSPTTGRRSYQLGRSSEANFLWLETQPCAAACFGPSQANPPSNLLG